MNNKINFFDELDNSWEKTLSNTYKKHNTVIVHDTKTNMNFVLDNQKNPELNTSEDYYEEIFTSEVNGTQYNISISTFVEINVIEEAFRSEEVTLYFVLYIYEAATSKPVNFIDIMFYCEDEVISEENQPSKIVKVEHTFIKEFINRSKPYIELASDEILYNKFIKEIQNTIPDID